MMALEYFAPVFEDAAPAIFALGAIFMRISAIAFFAPGIGERAIPVRVRLTVAIAFTIVLAPMVYDDARAAEISTLADVVEIYAAEAMVGLLIGFALRILVFVLQIAGAMIAQHLSLSQLFGPNIGFDSESPFTAILVMAGVTLAVSAGIHFHLARALGEAYDVFPFGVFPGASDTAEWTTHRVAAALTKSITLASPFIVLGFVYTMALAAANRAMPQLMAAFIGAPAITLAGFALFAVTAPVILYDWLAGFERVLLDFLAGAL